MRVEEEGRNGASLLLSVPVEVRENVYRYLFANIYVAQRKRWDNSDSLPFLRTCTQIHHEATAFLFNRTPLRLKVGHRQQTSSLPPPRDVIDRFQNIYFDIETINSTHSGYDFEIPFTSLVDKVINQPSLSSSSSDTTLQQQQQHHHHHHRNSCYLRCDLVQYAVGYSSQVIRKHINSFTGFETLTLRFEGSVLKSEFPQETIADDDPRRDSKLSTLRLRDGTRQREYNALLNAVKLFEEFEAVLGKGEVRALPESEKAMYGGILIVHPLHSTSHAKMNSSD